MYLNEAFRALSALNEDTFSVSDDGISKLADFQQNDDLVDEIKVIDPEATTEEDLADSYVGKVILDCCVCHSKLYKDKEEIELNEDETLANVGEECPFCYTPDGFKVVGEITTFGGVSDDDDDDTAEDAVSEEDTDDVAEDDSVEESLSQTPAEEITDPKSESKSEPLTESSDTVDEGLFGKKKQPAKPAATAKKRKWQVYDCWDKLVVGEYDTRPEAEESAAGRGHDGRYRVQMSESIEEGFKIVDRKTGFTIDNGFTTERDALNAIEDKYQSEIGRYKVIRESVNNVNVETDDSIVNVATDETGKVTVTTEPNTQDEVDAGDEVMVPVSDGTQTDIVAGNDEIPADEESVDVDLEEFDEESFDNLGESYLKSIYENVDSYRTTGVASKNDAIIVEGIIKFTSGAEKKTSFVFESKDCTKSGKYRLCGSNKSLAEGAKAFTLSGSINDGKFITESFNYNYKEKDAQGALKRVYGTIKG